MHETTPWAKLSDEDKGASPPALAYLPAFQCQCLQQSRTSYQSTSAAPVAIQNDRRHPSDRPYSREVDCRAPTRCGSGPRQCRALLYLAPRTSNLNVCSQPPFEDGHPFFQQRTSQPVPPAPPLTAQWYLLQSTAWQSLDKPGAPGEQGHYTPAAIHSPATSCGRHPQLRVSSE